MTLLGIAGAARSGKDTIAKIIKTFAPNTVGVAFATAVKEEADPICRAKFGISAFSEIPEEKKIIRPILIDIGHGHRQADPLIWIKKAEIKIDELLPQHNVIVTDVRYQNEAEMIKRKNGVVIFLKRTGQAEIPTEQESLPLIDWSIYMDWKDTSAIKLMDSFLPGWHPDNVSLGAPGRS